MRIRYIYILLSLLLIGCSDYTPTPKPRGYARIERKDTIQEVKFEEQQFSFSYLSDATVSYVKSEGKNDIWFNISYHDYDADIYCTYFPVSRKTLSGALEDTYQLAYSHAVKADGIDQVFYSDSINHIYGVMYDIKGDVASPVQFYITDSVSNFLRGSLYFQDIVKQDSVSPVIDFIRGDIVRIMESLRWKNTHSG